MEGLQMALNLLVSRLADPTVPKKENCVNIIGETGIATNKASNFAVMERLLREMGIEVNCRFLGDATVAEVKNLTAAPLNILASDTSDARLLKQFLIENYDSVFLEEPLPIGFAATKKWLTEIGKFFGCEEKAQALIEAERKAYEDRVALLREHLEGKKVFMTTINANIDWFLDTVEDVGLDLVHIGVYNYLRTPIIVSDHPERLTKVKEILDASQTRELLRELKPDIILSAYTQAAEDEHAITDALPMIPDLGVMSAIELMERWIRLMNTKRKGEWEHDRALFEKFFR